MRVEGEEQKRSYSVFSEFVKKDFKEIITEMHNAMKGTICKDLDCVKVIEKYGKIVGRKIIRILFSIQTRPILTHQIML